MLNNNDLLKIGNDFYIKHVERPGIEYYKPITIVSRKELKKLKRNGIKSL